MTLKIWTRTPKLISTLSVIHFFFGKKKKKTGFSKSIFSFKNFCHWKERCLSNGTWSFLKALQLMVIELEGLLDRTWIDKDHVDCPLFSVSQCIFCARQIAAAAEVPETVLCWAAACAAYSQESCSVLKRSFQETLKSHAQDKISLCFLTPHATNCTYTSLCFNSWFRDHSSSSPKGNTFFFCKVQSRICFIV